MMHARLTLSIAFALVTLVGCEPSCEATCDKLMSCDGIEMEHTSVGECAAACETQQNVYEKWSATDERDWFGDLKDCIDDASCKDIVAGECYDDELYIW